VIKDTVTVTVLLSKRQRTRNQKHKVYYLNHSEQIKTKKYNETHCEEKRERDNEYRENNRDILNTKLELIICECGCQSVRSTVDRHRKSESKKHIELMNRIK